MQTLSNIMCLVCLVVVGGIVASHRGVKSPGVEPVAHNAVVNPDTVIDELLEETPVAPPVLKRSPMLGASTTSGNPHNAAFGAQRWHEQREEAVANAEREELRQAAIDRRMKEAVKQSRQSRVRPKTNRGTTRRYFESIFERSRSFDSFGSIYGGRRSYGRYAGRNSSRYRSLLRQGGKRRIRLPRLRR